MENSDSYSKILNNEGEPDLYPPKLPPTLKKEIITNWLIVRQQQAWEYPQLKVTSLIFVPSTKSFLILTFQPKC